MPGSAAWLTRIEQRFRSRRSARAQPAGATSARSASCCFWLLAVSGIYLYAVLDTSVDGAYRSIDELSREQWYLGGVLRSLHRYAADAFVLVTLLHLLRELLLGRYTGFRRFSWLTGVPLLLFTFVCAIGGFWLNWDQLGAVLRGRHRRMARRAAAVFGLAADAQLPHRGAVSDRLFSLFVFVHIGVPLLLVFGLWFHIQRISRAAVFPPRALALGHAACPAGAGAGAAGREPGCRPTLSLVPGALALDWFLLFVHPLMYATSAGAVWALVAGATCCCLFVAAGACRSPPPRAGRAVDPDQLQRLPPLLRRLPLCRDHDGAASGRKPGRASWRRSTPICARVAASAPAPARRRRRFAARAELVTGIDMPQLPIGELRRRTASSGLAALDRRRRDRRVRLRSRRASGQRWPARDVAAFSLMCTGMLPPSFVEYALRGGAAGVLVTGCRAGGCEFRLGNRWTADRLAGMREPHLRARCRAAPAHRLGRPRRRRPSLPPRSTICGDAARHGCRGPSRTDRASTRMTAAWLRPLAWIGQVAAVRRCSRSSSACFSAGPPYRHLAGRPGADQAELQPPRQAGVGMPPALSAEELAKLPPNMRAPMDCPRERSPVSGRDRSRRRAGAAPCRRSRRGLSKRRRLVGLSPDAGAAPASIASRCD